MRRKRNQANLANTSNLIMRWSTNFKSPGRISRNNFSSNKVIAGMRKPILLKRRQPIKPLPIKQLIRKVQ